MHERMRRGALAEALAAGYLEERLGWTVLARNVRYRCGELDVVAWDGGVLVVVEVRSRFGAGGPRPEDTVTWPKQRRLLRATRRFVQERRLGSASVRFDVVAVDGQRRRVRAHYRGAFGEGDAAGW